MSKLRTSALALCALLGPATLPAGCASSSTTGGVDPITAREQQAVSTLKTRYPDVVTGTDVQNRTLAVFVNLDQMYSMDEGSETAMKAQALKEWTHVWSAAHPHKHALLRLSLRDYYGKEVYSAQAHV